MSGGVNFGFLEQHDPLLMHLAQKAECYLADDPNTCLFKLRQFGELLSKYVARLYRVPEQENFAATIQMLQREGVHATVIQGFHDLRRAGNDAVHGFRGDKQEALLKLKAARAMATWYHRVTKDRTFDPGPFVPPQDPGNEQIQQLQEQLQQALLEAKRAQSLAEAQAQLLELQAAEHAAATQSLTQPEIPAAAVPVEQLQAGAHEQSLVQDEADTRIKIDAQLRAAGWEVDTVELTYAKGARPVQGKSRAISEWPTPKGPADYVLFLGLQMVAVVEAKRKSKDVSASLVQARRYSEALPAPVPFLFASNGRPYLRQLQEKSGIWFRDERRPQNQAHALKDWYSPKGLEALLAQDIDQATQKLAQEPFAYLVLRDYQVQAIQAVEKAIADGQQDILLAMATGTGKTRTAIGLIYRLLKSKRFRRILFLVDRTTLGNQSHDAFKHFRLEQQNTFTDIYDVKSLGDVSPDETTKVHIATIQATIKRALENDEANAPVDQYDCILIDECHRGYTLDRELSDSELTYKNELDYISQYRRALDHFDAVRIGLTATPALHTTEIFGRPIFLYSYRQAVIDGYLVDHEPPLQIVTKLAQDGMVWPAQSQMQLYNTGTQTLDTTLLPDEVKIDLEKFNKDVLTENFNRAVCQELARHIDPELPGKTLIFCATDLHADMVVRLLKEEFENDQAVVKITGAADKPEELIRRFKNEKYPSIAVTVDLLTTGVDVPDICHIVFLRRVKSRILYQQMIGRATRLSKNFDKPCFHIYDAVELYKDMDEFSDMKPVVVNPKTTIEQLVRELTQAPAEARQEVLDQLLAKLQRKKRSLKDKTFQELAGQSLDDLLLQLRHQTPEQVATYFLEHFALISYLDTHRPNPAIYVVSTHEDEIAYTAQGFGPGNQAPGDYLEGFAHFIQQNLNEVAALTLVTQRPRDLTREDLRQLRLLLDGAGFSETQLKAAYRSTTNQDIAASIIGFIRQKALGSPLIPYEERVNKALSKIMASRPWTDKQRKWLDRIAKQLKKEVIVDRQAIDQGEFAANGGFQALNKSLDGQLESLLGQFQDAIWDDVA